jgi:hypothetical protein
LLFVVDAIATSIRTLLPKVGARLLRLLFGGEKARVRVVATSRIRRAISSMRSAMSRRCIFVSCVMCHVSHRVWMCARQTTKLTRIGCFGFFFWRGQSVIRRHIPAQCRAQFHQSPSSRIDQSTDLIRKRTIHHGIRKHPGRDVARTQQGERCSNK